MWLATTEMKEEKEVMKITIKYKSKEGNLGRKGKRLFSKRRS